MTVDYLDQPKQVNLETLALCNARCTFCPYPGLERIGEKMPDALIDRLVEEMAAWKMPFFFSPFKVNEPLLDSRLIPLCQKVEQTTAAFLRIFTNGSALTLEKAQQIGGLKKVYQLWVSLNSHDPVEYERLMGLKFEQTAKRLDALHSSDFPHPVVLSCVGFPNEDFRRYCAERWPRFTSLVIRKTGWLGEVEPQDAPVPDTLCSRWWELSIMANGIVSLCCQDSDGRFAIGDLNKQTMLEIYNAPAYRERRESRTSRAAVPVCKTCNY